MEAKTKKILAYAGIGLGVLWILGEMRQTYLAKRGVLLSSGCIGKEGTCFDISLKLFRKPLNKMDSAVNDKESCQKEWEGMTFKQPPTEKEREIFLTECRNRGKSVATLDTVLTEM